MCIRDSTTVKLAQELYASREHLSRAFKECTMESIHSYLTHLRMQHCRKALEDGVSVLNACTESGFPDYSSFLKTFRRLYGICLLYTSSDCHTRSCRSRRNRCPRQ